MRIFGLIGHPVSHSFSENFFTEKFSELELNDHKYLLFDLPEINKIAEILRMNPELAGFNVTIPHKKEIMNFLSEVEPMAREIGSVNVVKVVNGNLLGFNTDYFGFKESLLKWKPNWKGMGALVLGSGGSSSAVLKVLKDLGIDTIIVSRRKGENRITYQDLKENMDIVRKNLLIINTSPLGMFPQTDTLPDLEYSLVSEDHFAFDLVYNPEKTLFLKECEKRGASIKNGLEMLYIQAERSWEIWNS